MKRRILAILLACMMVVSVFPMTAFAEGELCAEHSAEDGTLASTVEPTCTTIGYDLYTCDTCGHYFATNFVEATGEHDYSVEVPDTAVAATCTQPGKEADMECSMCGDIQTGAAVTVDHSWGNEIVDPDVCGGSYKECTVCGAISNQDAHTWSEHPEIVREPDAWNDGEAKFVCENEECGAEKFVPILRQCGDIHPSVSNMGFSYIPCGETVSTTVNYCRCNMCGIYFKTNEGNGKLSGEIGDDAAYRAWREEIIAQGHEYEEQRIEPTCTVAGAVIEVCTKCGAQGKAQIIYAPGHELGELLRSEAATCEKDGYDYYDCLNCEEEAAEWTSSKKNHNSWQTVVVPATCLTPAYQFRYCTFENCDGEKVSEYTVEYEGETYTVDVTVDGEPVHLCGANYGVWDEELQQHVWTTYYVRMYGSTIYGNHVWDVSTVTKNPTCDQPGTEVKICTVHGVTTTVTLPATGHDYAPVEGVEEIVATCVVDGYKLEACTVCGKEQKTETPAYSKWNNLYTTYEAAVAHHAALAAEGTVLSAGDCETVGYASYACAECGNNVVVAIEGTGSHQWDTPAVEDTCTQEGATEGGKCLNCDAEQEIVTFDNITHDWYTVSEAYDNCENGAKNALWECLICGEAHEENNGEMTRDPGHNYEFASSNVLQPVTCERSGYVEDMYVCSQCGNHRYSYYSVPALGHDISLVSSREANCTEFGYEYYVCANGELCNQGYNGEYITNYVPAFGHTEVTDEAVETSCTAPGLTEGKHCETCGEVLEAQEEIEQLPHQNAAGDTLENKCTNLYEDRFCVNGCEGEIANDHHTALRELENVPATCTEDGYTITICEDCWTEGDEEIVTIVKALGHDMSDWIVDEEPTVEAAGKKHKECSRCDYTEEDTIPALAKDLAFAITVDNVNASGKGYTDSSLISVTIAISAEEGKSVDIWGLQYELSYDADALTFVGIEQASDKFAAVTYNAADGAVTMIASTADGAATSNATITDEAYVLATLQFRVTTASGAVELKAEAESIDADGYALDVAPATESIDVEAFMDVDAKDGVNLADLLAAYEAAIAGEYNVVADVDKSGALDFEDILNICEYLVGAYAYEDMTALGQ